MTGLWLGLWSGAVVNVYEGKVRKSVQLPDTQSDALSASGVRQLRFDPDGALWIARRTGLTRIDRGRVSSLDSRSGMPCDGVYWSLLDDQSDVGLHDLAAWSKSPGQELDAWAGARG